MGFFYLDKTFDYVYNGIGNILSVKTTTANGSATTKSFTYNGDRLTSYGGTSISYNAMGCPILYGSKHLDWANGRLTKYYDEPDPSGAFSSESVRFEYNAYGQRTLKEYVYDPGSDYSGDFLIGTTSEYTYDHSGRLISELITDYFTESASVEKELVFLYDESGMIGVMYSYNGSTPTPYYYQRNLQGDVVAIYDTNGSKKASYSYDAYGNCTTTNSALYDIAYNTPIRYRGYYYDRETNFYYLNARYYNPEWRRFISPDDTAFLDPESVNGLNLYCYCGNDPVNYCDPSGHDPLLVALLIGLGIGVAAGLGYAAYTDYQDDYDINGSIGLNYLRWGIIGGALGAGGIVSKAKSLFPRTRTGARSATLRGLVVFYSSAVAINQSKQLCTKCHFTVALFRRRG